MIVELGKSWGYPLPNGSFDGMVGALGNKLIDFGSSPIFVRPDRAKFIDYGRNTWSWKSVTLLVIYHSSDYYRAGFLFRSPKSRTSIEIFLKPLSTSIWLITGFLATASIVILKMVTTFEQNQYHNETETSWSLSFLFTLGALCQQGTPHFVPEFFNKTFRVTIRSQNGVWPNYRNFYFSSFFNHLSVLFRKYCFSFIDETDKQNQKFERSD